MEGDGGGARAAARGAPAPGAAAHTELKSIILQSEELDARHEALKADTQEINRTRDELATRGDELRNRLAATLQTVHGFRSEKLLEFGIQPRRPRGRDLKARKRRSSPVAAPVSAGSSADSQ